VQSDGFNDFEGERLAVKENCVHTIDGKAVKVSEYRGVEA
jgi:hypothetical protein